MTAEQALIEIAQAPFPLHDHCSPEAWEFACQLVAGAKQAQERCGVRTTLATGDDETMADETPPCELAPAHPGDHLAHADDLFGKEVRFTWP